MACLEIFTSLFFFSFLEFLPHVASTTCPGNCSSDYHCSDGPSRTAEIATVMGVVISVGLWLVWFSMRLIGSDSIDEQLPVSIICGLDQKTIESYPTTQLGESRELPSSSDNACPICLEEYQAKETIRTIPECNHYFHADCVDKWLTKNPTCPLCRNPPEGERDKTD